RIVGRTKFRCSASLHITSQVERGPPMMIALIAVAVLALLIVFLYNGLIRLRVQCDNAWADIDVQLKRRYDLIPNMVETVKGYGAHERGTFEAVVAARSQAMSAQGPAAKGQAEGMLTGALRQLFALSEAYPQLRAAENFAQLQATLSQIEDNLQNARRYTMPRCATSIRASSNFLRIWSPEWETSGPGN